MAKITVECVFILKRMGKGREQNGAEGKCQKIKILKKGIFIGLGMANGFGFGYRYINGV